MVTDGSEKGGGPVRGRLGPSTILHHANYVLRCSRRGHPHRHRGKWKSINKDKTRLGEALICRITFLICVKYPWVLSLGSRDTHERARTAGRGRGPPGHGGRSYLHDALELG